MTTMAIMRGFNYSEEDFTPLKIDNDGDRFCFQCERTFWPGEVIDIIKPGTIGNYAWIGRRCRYSCKAGAEAAAARSKPSYEVSSASSEAVRPPDDHRKGFFARFLSAITCCVSA